MARLPQPGKDSGVWGDVLNDYLSQIHKPDGSLKDNVVGSEQLTPNLRAKLDTNTPSWATLEDKPAIIAAGADQVSARSAIGAGTSNLVIGTTGSTAKAGDYQPASTNISDSTAIGRTLLTASDANQARVALNVPLGRLKLSVSFVAVWLFGRRKLDECLLNPLFHH